MRSYHFIAAVVIAVAISILLSAYMSIDASSFIGFVAFLAMIVYFDKKAMKFFGLGFMRRTKKGRDFIDKTANRHPKFWRYFGNAGIILCIPLMFLGTFYLANQAFLVAGGAEGGIKLVLPGPVSQPTDAPGAFFFPWWIWVIAIAIIIIPHEMSHGIMCRIDRVRIKSVGWLLFLIIPGAFVEPDEAQLKRMKRSTKMRVYAAGSFMNMFVAFIIILAFMIITPLTTAPAGIYPSVVKDAPAYNANLTGAILSIDGMPIYSQDDLVGFLKNKQPGETVSIMTQPARPIPAFVPKLDFFIPKPLAALDGPTKQYAVTLTKHPERDGAYLGVVVAAQAVTFNGNLALYQPIALLLLYIFMFSFGIGLVNMLPLKPFDGGLLFEEVVTKFTVRHKKPIIWAAGALVLFLIIFNLVMPIIL